MTLRRTTPLPRAARPMARSALPSRSGPIRKKKRKVSEQRRIYGPPARVTFVTRLPCAACGYAGDLPRHNAHGETGGTSRKADYLTILPLCAHCHAKQHGVNGGWLAIGMTAESRRRAAANTQAAWEASRGDPLELDDDASM